LYAKDASQNLCGGAICENGDFDTAFELAFQPFDRPAPNCWGRASKTEVFETRIGSGNMDREMYRLA
jgi:hypothetical protein